VQRSLILLVTLLAMLWHGMAGAGVRVWSDALSGHTQGAVHASLHWADVSHHHHDDGSIAEDDSPASVQHMTTDGSVGSIAPFPDASPTPVPAAQAAPSYLAPPLPRPYLDPLQRPPRA
jgi:hypothetical protein